MTLPIGVLAHADAPRDLLLRSLPATSPWLFTDEIYAGARLRGVLLVVDAAQGIERCVHLPLAHARRCGLLRIALLLVHRAETDAELLAFAEAEARSALQAHGFDAACAPAARAPYEGVGIYARIPSLTELFAALAPWSIPEPDEASPASAQPPPLPPAAASRELAAAHALLDALWPRARLSTLLRDVAPRDVPQPGFDLLAARAAADALFDLAPAEPCCGQPRERRMVIDLRAMQPPAPPELGAFVVTTCHRHLQCNASGSTYLIRHLPRERLPPTRFAACTYPWSFGGPRPTTVLVVDHPRWMCANPESVEDYWGPSSADFVAALRGWTKRPGNAAAPIAGSVDEDLELGETLEAALEALALSVPIEERSGGPLLVQSGGWIPLCNLCHGEEHVVFQTQAFTGDNTTILVACPAHPDTASIIVLRL